MKITILTWNMQGADSKDPYKQGNKINTLKRWIGCFSEPFVMCIQESGRHAFINDAINDGSLQLVDNRGVYKGTIRMGSRLELFVLFYEDADAGNNRCSLAVITRAEYTTKETRVIWHETDDGLRPSLGIKIKDADNLEIFSHHAPSSEARFAASYSINQLDDVSAGNGYNKFVYAGDFNCSPIELEKKFGRKPWKCTCSSKETHKSGGRIDYVVTPENSDINLVIPPAAIKGDNLSSDHYPQFFEYTT
ncbi:endonuclease/exonuclease/phosphatase family protein [Paenibacillus mucilaginosus]|uniref:Cytolethal distending toxin protein B n=1 Tax=Paenibacillus mucilaginosus 3016 TaxID=1116391 RepID=H6NNY6_9BACL|nr:endonuclease/exonuclease/phosphatase family protein [Paenibacillus mucilaginosus]AFC30512.1 cytolethal distending toxin protein B [Paenibacillus mucilaginosus 3016]MCG7216877.1 endonuclease/exonuclease/phosphatase family protein [Paenibacillus mucilaginosus]WDM30974.1 endonuclease/exonuclease/phosphatase family protein [Paenibacillus mucilaginosus]